MTSNQTTPSHIKVRVKYPSSDNPMVFEGFKSVEQARKACEELHQKITRGESSELNWSTPYPTIFRAITPQYTLDIVLPDKVTQ